MAEGLPRERLKECRKVSFGHRQTHQAGAASVTVRRAAIAGPVGRESRGVISADILCRSLSARWLVLHRNWSTNLRVQRSARRNDTFGASHQCPGLAMPRGRPRSGPRRPRRSRCDRPCSHSGRGIGPPDLRAAGGSEDSFREPAAGLKERDQLVSGPPPPTSHPASPAFGVAPIGRRVVVDHADLDPGAAGQGNGLREGVRALPVEVPVVEVDQRRAAPSRRRQRRGPERARPTSPAARRAVAKVRRR